MKDSLGLMNFHEAMKMLKVSKFQNTQTTRNTAKLKIDKYMFKNNVNYPITTEQKSVFKINCN